MLPGLLLFGNAGKFDIFAHFCYDAPIQISTPCNSIRRIFMKTTIRLIAAVLCGVLLLGILGCADNPEQTQPTEATGPALSVQELYTQARAAVLASPNQILTYTLSETRTVGGQTYSKKAAGTASFSGIGTDAMEAIIEEDLTYGTLSAEHALTYCDGTAYSQISGCTFASAMTAADFVSQQLPAVLLDGALYGTMDVQTNEDGSVISFADPTGLEAWVTDSAYAQPVSASGTATLDTSGNLVASAYQTSYTCGPASYMLEVTVRVSVPETLDLSAVHPDHSETPVTTLFCLDAPKMLMQAVGDIFTAQDMQCSISETFYSQTNQLIRTRQSSAAISGTGKDMVASLTNNLQITDYRGQTTNSTQNYYFADGVCTSSKDGAEPTVQAGVTEESMRVSIEDSILAGLFATSYLASADLTDTGDFYILRFTGNEAYCADLSADIGEFLNTDLDGSATSFETTEAAGYLSINKQTGLPAAMGISFARVYTFSEVPYQLSYQLDQALTLSGTDAYYAATGALETETAPKETATPLFYKVTGEGGQQLWLLGTIHAGDSRTAFLPQQILDAFHSSSALAVEFDTLAFEEQAATDVSLQTQLAGIYYYTDGTKTDAHISSDLYQSASDLILASGNSNINAPYMKVAVWNSLLEDFYLSQSHTLSFQKGVDIRLLRLAKALGKTIIDIESGISQLNMLTGFSDEIQSYLLRDTVSTGCTAYCQSVQALYELWCQGDEAALTAAIFPDNSNLSEAELALYNQYNDIMITQRNKLMLSTAISQLESGSTVFYAVGLAHVLGENGLVNGLRSAGYTVELISYT